MAAGDRRFPCSVYRTGSEPDIRFSLANERTFLAWIRTSLALLAAGIALGALELPIEPRLRLVAALLFIVLGTATPARGSVWRSPARSSPPTAAPSRWSRPRARGRPSPSSCP